MRVNSFRHTPRSAIPLLMLVLSIGWNSAKGQEPKEVVKTQFITLSLNGIVDDYYYRTAKGIQKLEANGDGIGMPIPYEGPQLLALYQKIEDLNPVPEGQKPPEPLCQVTLPKGANRSLLLFAFSGKPDDPPQVKAYGIQNTDFSGGDYRVFNFSSRDAYLAMNDEKVQIAAGKIIDVRGSKWGAKVQDMKVMLGAKTEEKIVPVYSSVWGHRPERRSFLFIFDKNDPKRPFNIKKFFDVPSYKPQSGEGVDTGDASASEE